MSPPRRHPQPELVIECIVKQSSSSSWDRSNQRQPYGVEMRRDCRGGGCLQMDRCATRIDSATSSLGCCLRRPMTTQGVPGLHLLTHANIIAYSPCLTRSKRGFVRQPDVRAGVRSGAAIQVQLVFAVQELAGPPRRHPQPELPTVKECIVKQTSSSGGIGLTSVLTIVFVVLKLADVIDWSWVWVLSPLWIGGSIGLTVLLTGNRRIAVCGVCPIRRRPRRRF